MSLFPRIVANEFAPMFRLMDDYASHVATRGRPAAQTLQSHFRTFQPRFDIKENKESYELQGELPGIEQKDLTIEFSDPQTISIRGRTERTREEGTRPSAAAAAIESQPSHPEQQQITSEAAGSETSSNYQKASVEAEDDATMSGANPDAASTTTATEAGDGVATPATEAASEAPQQVTTSQQAPKVEGPKYWLSERSVGTFSRTFQFDHRVDVDAVKASLKNGILSIVVPKAAAPVSRTINVE